MIKQIALLSLLLLVFSLNSCSNTSKKSVEEDSQAKVVNSAAIPTYVFYYADWCPYCHKMAPLVEKAAKEYQNRVFFYYVNVDKKEGKEFTAKYRPNGKGIPFAQLYDGKGYLQKERIGAYSYQSLESDLKKLLK